MGASRRYRRRLAARRPDGPGAAQDLRQPDSRACVDDMSAAAARWYRSPDWVVLLVHSDPDGPCDAPDCRDHHGHPAGPGGVHADFGYTAGLHDRHGLPELHCPAIPAAGPAGFTLGARSLSMVLTAAGARCAAGDLTPGGSFDLTASQAGHRFRMRFTLAAPVPPEDCSAFQANPDATVIPIVWGVHPDVECLTQDAP